MEPQLVSLSFPSRVVGAITAIGNDGSGAIGVISSGDMHIHIVRVFGDNVTWAWGSDVIAAVDEECADAGSNIVSTSLGRGGKGWGNPNPNR